VARGEENSRPIQVVIDEINTLHRLGINEVILTGVHLGGYGSDLDSNLSELIKTILADTDIPRLRLGSLEPWELPADFFQLFDNPRLMPHLHLPLQSGSDTVLRRMARRCKTDEFAAIVKQLRTQTPHFNITTDIIVGFPAESEQEWQDSFDTVQRIGFGHIHIFTYSRREGTKAATLPDQLTNDIKKQRSQQLHELADTLKQQFYTANIGNEFPVLWEGYSEPLADGKHRVFGYTPNYLRVSCVLNAAISVENQTINTRLIAVEDGVIIGELVQ
jgi:threonylcarbamoyladenosine tRNA methylthiotransferase MtaB